MLTANQITPSKTPSFRKLASVFLKWKIEKNTAQAVMTTGIMDSKSGRCVSWIENSAIEIKNTISQIRNPNRAIFRYFFISCLLQFLNNTFDPILLGFDHSQAVIKEYFDMIWQRALGLSSGCNVLQTFYQTLVVA
jgi:hypothetical protein